MSESNVRLNQALELESQIEFPKKKTNLIRLSMVWSLVVFVVSGWILFMSRPKKLEFIQIPNTSYFMSQTEITVGQYRQCVEAGTCNTEGLTEGGLCNWRESGRDHYPINCVDCNQARQFAQWVGGDLPTEEQWEFAAKGGEHYVYAGSDHLDEVGWYYNNNHGSTHPVGRKKANGYGLYDMSGNVWECTLSVWSPSSSKQVIRGGGWNRLASDVRVDFRGMIIPSSRSDNLGFRVIKFDKDKISEKEPKKESD